MHLNDDPTSVGVRPAQPADAGHSGWFAAASPGAGVPTVLQWAFMNSVSAELKNAIEAAGQALDKANDTQLLQAIQTIADASGAAGGNLPTTTINPTPGNPTTRITFSAGVQRDNTNTARLALAAPISKKLDAVWAAGTGNGGRDVAGAPAAGQTWHCFVIWNPTGPVVDALFSQSLTNPTLPGGYTKFRRVGSILLDGSVLIRNFLQKPGGFFYYLGGPVVDYANQANGGGPNSRAVTVPQGIKPYVNFHFQSAGTFDNNPYYSGIFDPDHGAPPAFGTSAQRAQIRRISATNGSVNYAYETDEFWEWTDRTAHILTYSSDASDTIAVKTRGWQDLDLASFV